MLPKMDLMSQSFKVRDRTDYVIHLKFHFPFFRKQNRCLFDSVILGGPSEYLLKEEVNNLENVAYVLRSNITQLLLLKWALLCLKTFLIKFNVLQL